MKSNMITRRAMQLTECEECSTAGTVCELHNTRIKELDIPPQKGFTATSKEYETNKTYQDKGEDTGLQVTMAQTAAPAHDPAKAILQYIKTKKVQLTQLLQKRGEDVVIGKVVKDLQETVPTAATVNTNTLAGVIVKYLIQSEAVREGHRVPTPFNDSQFLQEITPVLERKQASMKPEIYCPNCDSEAAQSKPGFVSCPDCGYDGPDDFYGVVSPKTKMKNQKASSPKTALQFDDGGKAFDEGLDRLRESDPKIAEYMKEHPGVDSKEAYKAVYGNAFSRFRPEHTVEASISDLHLAAEEQGEQAEEDHKNDIKVAASGGAETIDPEEPEDPEDPETSLDSSVVALLDACKNEWTNLGEPVNPATWPKEIERAILDLNDSVTKAIAGVQESLVEGEYYIKNVDEGVEADGGGSEIPGMGDLNLSPAEEGHDEMPPIEKEPKLTNDMLEEKVSSKKTAAVDTTAAETKKAIKFVEDLQDKIAGIFFDYKKAVDSANNSALVKSAGEDMVRLRAKLNEIQKVLDKQFSVLENAEQSVEDAMKKEKKSSSKKADLDGQGDISELRDALKDTWEMAHVWLEGEPLEMNYQDDKSRIDFASQAMQSLNREDMITALKDMVEMGAEYVAVRSGEYRVDDVDDPERDIVENAIRVLNRAQGKTSSIPTKSAKKEVPEFIKKKQEEAKEKKEKKESSLFGGLSLVAADESDEEYDRKDRQRLDRIDKQKEKIQNALETYGRDSWQFSKAKQELED